MIKKIIISIFICISLLVISYSYNIFTSNNIKEEEKVPEVFSLFIEQEDGTYLSSEESTWPTGYELNLEKSYCKAGSTLIWNADTKSVMISSDGADECYVYMDILPPPKLTDVVLESGLASGELIQHTPEIATSAGDNNYRYSGANPNNWVCFGSDEVTCPEDNLYRILGIYNIDGEQKVKLIKEKELESLVFDAKGDNRWEGENTTDSSDDADINIYLNNTFYNALPSKYQNMISEEKYNIGNVTQDYPYKPKDFYEDEIVTKTEQMYKTGLMYPSDYLYGTSQSYWDLYNYENGSSTNEYYNNNETKTNNWIFKGLNEWTLVPNSSYAGNVWLLNNFGGYAHYNYARNENFGRPVLYLKSNVSIISGSGTEEEPYRLG